MVWPASVDGMTVRIFDWMIAARSGTVSVWILPISATETPSLPYVSRRSEMRWARSPGSHSWATKYG